MYLDLNMLFQSLPLTTQSRQKDLHIIGNGTVAVRIEGVLFCNLPN